MEQKTEASQAVDDPMRAVLQEILDIEEIRLWLIEKDHFSHVYWFKSKQEDYATRSAGLLDKVRAALKAQPAPADPVAWMCPNDPDSASAFIWARNGVDYSNMSCDSCGGKHVPVYRQPAPTEAAQAGAGLAAKGALSANSNLTTSGVTCQPVAAQGNTSNNSSSSQLSGNSGELANKQLFENIEELQPSGNTGELAQGWDVDDLISDMDINEEVAGMRAELQASSTIIPSILAAQGEDSARLDALHDQMVDTIYMDDGRVIDVGGKHLNDLRKAIDAFLARASAETGGVKP